MPIDTLPLFRPEVLRPHLATFALPQHVQDEQPRVARWATLLESTHGQGLNEKELLPDFLSDVFGHVLGCRGPADRDAAGRYTMSRERHVEVDGKFADAVLGTVGIEPPTITAAVEDKGPRELARPLTPPEVTSLGSAYPPKNIE
jgi:hypothetical protein